MGNNHEYDVSLDAMLLAGAQVYPAVLNASIELNIFKIIGEGSPKGMSPSESAPKLPNPHADTVRRLDRLLYLLASHSVLTCSCKKVDDDGRTERLSALSPAGKNMFPDEDGISYASISKLCYHPSYVNILLSVSTPAKLMSTLVRENIVRKNEVKAIENEEKEVIGWCLWLLSGASP